MSNLPNLYYSPERLRGFWQAVALGYVFAQVYNALFDFVRKALDDFVDLLRSLYD